jgi:phosphoglycolate phosphatase
MRPFPFDVVAFDLDGTLADTAPDLAAAMNHALVRLGRAPVAADTARHMIGHGGREMLRKGLAATGGASEALVGQGFSYLLEYYSANLCNGTKAYPELDEALEALAKRGAKLAVCTNKSEALSRRLIQTLGWQERFASIVGHDTLGLYKPDPLPLHEAIARAGGGRAAFVGDSIIDADTARAAQMPFVAVSFGFSDRPVDQLGADAVIHRYGDLIPILEGL